MFKVLKIRILNIVVAFWFMLAVTLLPLCNPINFLL